MAHEYTTWAYAQNVKPAGCKFVLVALADSADSTGRSFRGQKNLAEMTGQSERAVRDHLDALERAGFVRRVPRFRSDGTRTSDECFLPPKGEDGEINHRHILPPADFAAGRKRIDHRQISHSPPAESAGQEPSVEPSVKNRQKRDSEKPAKPSKKFDPISVDLPPFVDPQAWADFVGHRSEIRKPLTQRAARLILADLEKQPADANEMLATSVKRGWTGVFPLDKPRNAPKASPKLATADDFKAEVTADDLLQPGRL